MIKPIPFRRSTVSAAIEAKHHPRFPVLAFARDRERVDRSICMGHHAIRRGLRKCRENHVDHAQNGFGISACWRRKFCRQNRTFGNNYIDRAHNTCICREVLKDMFDRDISGCNSCRKRNVDWTCTLWRGPREIQRQLIPLDFKGNFDRQRRILDAVIVKKVLGLPTAIWKGFKFRAH